MKDKTGKKKIKRFGMFMQANLLLVFILVTLLLVVLIGRLVYLNYSVGDKYEKRVLSQQTYVSNAIAYKRGSITDRNGTVLAKSVRVYNLIIDAKKMLSDENYKEPTFKALEECFDIDTDEVQEILDNKPNSQYVVFQKSVAADKVQAFEDMQDEDENIEGVWFEEDYTRVYPYSTLAADVIGFTSSGTSTGIESYYDEELTGEDGREYGYFDSDLNLQRTVKEAVNGNTVVTTLDAQVQTIVEEKVAEFNEEIGSSNTAVLVMNPQNGDIYAMTSGDSYDLNNPKDLSSLYTEKELASMTDDEKLEALNQLWRNFVVSDMYEPGSTFKPVTVAGALEEGVVTTNTTFSCPGYHMVNGVKIRCSGTHNTVTLQESLMYSCNSALMQIGEKLTASLFYKQQTNFMFGSKTGIDLPAETSGYIFTEDELQATELATSTFGQGFKSSMLQIAAAVSSIINGGDYIEPHVLKEITSESGTVVETKEPVVVKKTVSEETSDYVKEFLYQTVEEGTATIAQVDGYTIGGKTGTAEKFPRGNGKYLVSFIGFAPVDDPEVVIYVVIDEPDVEDQAHSSYATQLFHDIAEEILPFLGIQQTETTTSEDSDTEDTQSEEDTTSKTDDTSDSQDTSDDASKEDKEDETSASVGDESAAQQDDGVSLPAVDEN